MIRFTSLGSGSSGNCLVVQSGRTHVLVDCGFPVRETVRRLARVGLAPDQINAVLVTHEHSDHIGSSAAFCRRHRLPVHLTPGTRLAARDRQYPQVLEFHAGERFSVGELDVHPFTVPHDAREPAQFVFSDGAVRLGLLTDLGHVSQHVLQHLRTVDGLLLECNHDPELLAAGPYPPSLKRRVGGPYGHLPNHAATELLRSIDRDRLQHVVGMHLSETNNRRDLAQTAIAAGLGCALRETSVAGQAEGFPWRELR